MVGGLTARLLDFTRLDFSGLNFNGLNFSGLNFSGLDFSGFNFGRLDAIWLSSSWTPLGATAETAIWNVILGWNHICKRMKKFTAEVDHGVLLDGRQVLELRAEVLGLGRLGR